MDRMQILVLKHQDEILGVVTTKGVVTAIQAFRRELEDRLRYGIPGVSKGVNIYPESPDFLMKLGEFYTHNYRLDIEMWIDHSEHGRGDAESGPDESDCPCRETQFKAECASSGCGFCHA